MVNESNQTNNEPNDENRPIDQFECQTTDDGEVTNDKKCANNYCIEFNNVKVYCRLSDDQVDSSDLLDHLFKENDIDMDQLNNLEYVLTSLAKSNDLERFKLAERLLNLIQTDRLRNVLNLVPVLVQLIHPIREQEIDQQDELFLQTRKYAMDTLDELLRRTGEPEEQKVNDLLNQLRYFCSDLHKIQFNKQNSNEFTALDLTIVEHPIDAICNLMKISFDEHYRILITRLGGIEAISQLLASEHKYHGFLLNNYDKIRRGELPIKIEEKWLNHNCIAIRRYTAMALTNLTFGDKQSKIQLCLDFCFLESLLAQLNCLFCEELIQVTASVLRNLSWKASKICKTVLSELNSAAMLMHCSMQIKKETTLKVILYALWNLSSHNLMNKQMICEVDGSIKYLISLLEYQSADNTLTIVENSSGVFKNVASFLVKSDHLRKILRQNNCHEILLKKLRSTSLTLVCNSVNILWNVSKDNLVDQKMLINLGAISMLKNLTLSKHKIIAIASKETLKNLLTSQCLKNSEFDLEIISFRAFSSDCLNRSSLLDQRKRMLLKRELKNSLKEAESLACSRLVKNQPSHHGESERKDDLNNFFDSVPSGLSNQQSTSVHNDSTKCSNRNVEVLDVSHSTSDYFSDLYKDDHSTNEYTIEHILQGSNGLQETNLDTILSDKFYMHTNSNMFNSVHFFPGYLQVEESKRDSIYSTISEPIMYYDNSDQFTFEKDCHLNEEILEEEYRKLTKLSINNDFNLYDSNSIFHAYPVVIQESGEFNANKLIDDDLYRDLNKKDQAANDSNEKMIDKEQNCDRTFSSKLKRRSQGVNCQESRIPVPVKQTVKSQQKIQTKQCYNGFKATATIRPLKSAGLTRVESKKQASAKSKLAKLPQIKKSKTMEKNIHVHASLPKSRTTDYLFDRTFELATDDVNSENDLTYNVEQQHNLTYTLPSSESDRTLKNDQQTEQDERTLIPDEDERTDKNLDELNTYVQNLSLGDNAMNNDEDDDPTIHSNEINVSIDAESIENLNLIDDIANGGLDGTELTDSIFVERNIENAKPPKIYHQINYSVASSLNNSLFTNDGHALSTMKSKSNDSSIKSSRLRSPKARVWSTDRTLSASSPTNTFTITKSTKPNRSQSAQSKDQAMSTSGYQTSLNSSMLSNNSLGVIDKINPPSILNQISGVSSLNNSATDCISTCESISSINSDIYDLSTNGSLNSSFTNGSFKQSNIVKTSTPKHMIKQSTSKIAKPVTRVTNSRDSNLKSNLQNHQPLGQLKTDTFRKNKTIKKSNTSSISSTVSSSLHAKSAPLKSNNQENVKGGKIPASKSLSRISSQYGSHESSDLQQKKMPSKMSSLSSSLWKKTVSNQQNISSKIFKKKSIINSTDKGSNLQANCALNTNSLTRSSTFEKLPTTNQEATKMSSMNANKNRIRPVEQREKRSVYH